MNWVNCELHRGSHKITTTVPLMRKKRKNEKKKKRKNSYIKEVCTRIVSNKVLKKVVTSFSELSKLYFYLTSKCN